MKLKETFPRNTKLLLLQKSLPLILLAGIFLTLIFYNPKQWRPLLLLKLTTSQISNNPLAAEEVEECDIFTGEWVPNPEAPYYTNSTCRLIHEQQNCMKYGRLDSEFIKWRWKPHGCELPLFNPSEFLERVRGKSMAFVGDSLGRNQMESLLCLLSQVRLYISQTVFYCLNKLGYLEGSKLHGLMIFNCWKEEMMLSEEVNLYIQDIPNVGLCIFCNKIK